MKRYLALSLAVFGCAFVGYEADLGITGLHGFLYMAPDLGIPGIAQTNRVDVAASSDRTKIVVTLVDIGQIYSSTNSGMTWTLFTAPGKYDFPLTSGPDGMGLSFQVTIYPSAEDLMIGNLPAPSYATGGPPATNSQPKKLVPHNWYAVASAPDGRKLVITDSVSNEAPVLSIVHSSDGLVVSWPSAFKGFILQASADISTTNWDDVADAVTIAGENNQVLVSPAVANKFFRLRSQ
jgi:hypothetical protein